jgi:hypothetical protein
MEMPRTIEGRSHLAELLVILRNAGIAVMFTPFLIIQNTSFGLLRRFALRRSGARGKMP